MASGLVAKKIALFEPRTPRSESSSGCRLKRKHAIRRKRYCRERRLISEPNLSSSLSEDEIDGPIMFCASSEIALKNLSASCSAFLDLIYNNSDNSSKQCMSPIINFKDKKILCRSSSLEEAFPARLNIIDIDIEIRVEQQDCSPSLPAEIYEPIMKPVMSSSCIDKIKLTAKVDKHKNANNNKNLANNCSSSSSENYNSSTISSSNSSNYLCTNCGNYNANSDNLQEHIYENFALVPPPRPPKLKPLQIQFGILHNKGIDNCDFSSSVSVTNSCEEKNNAIIVTHTDTEVHETDKEPFYEDLYDYCLPPDCLLDFDCIQQPSSITSFVNDKDDEVEYCDISSTCMAMSISNLNSGGTVIYNNNNYSVQELPKTVECSSRISLLNSNRESQAAASIVEFLDQNGVCEHKDKESKEEEEPNNKLNFFYLDSLDEGGNGIQKRETKKTNEITVPLLRSCETLKPNNLNSTSGDVDDNKSNNPVQETNFVDLSSFKPVLNDSNTKDKKDEDDLDKPLPNPPSSNYTSSNSSDSFYSEPIYGITNQITHYASKIKNPGPPVPDTLRRPSLTSNQIQQSIISCNNVIRHEPSLQTSVSKCSSTKTVPIYGNNIIYADSVSTCNKNGFEPSDKLPPIPPSKLSTIAKSAGKKLAKKFMGIRKTSKSSIETFVDVSSSSSSSPNGFSSSKGKMSPVQSSTPNMQISQNFNAPNKVNQSQLRRPISRPSIPPPEPPKSIYGGSSNGSAQNYSIYDKSEPRNTAEDDDFDDSDFYDSDSELIRNFVSQVQPIYSMEEEPLYQYYAYGISIKPEDDSDYQPVIPKNLGLTLDMLVPRVGQRTLWCELSEVNASGILSILCDKQKQLQEAIFEILTSEASYLKSLDVLINVFYKNKELISVLTEEERNFLFGNIEEVRECAQSFLGQLLAEFKKSWYIQEIGEIVNHNANTRFLVYKEYCRNKPHQDKTMQKLRHSRDEFVNVIKTLEEDSRCQLLQVDSFLMLPMQRITRLPLLVNAVIQRTTSVKEKSHCEEALKSLTNLVLECNDAARESQDAEETSSILEKLEFNKISSDKPLSSFGQFQMKGDFMKNPFDQGRGGNQINWTFRKSKRTLYWLLLFANQMLITKRKANGKYEVIDQSAPEDAHIKPLPNLEGVANDFQNFFMLHFDKKETVYFLAARTNSEIERWKTKLESMMGAAKKLRVESIFPYEARRPDELSFGVGDAIEVSQMQPDGWYYGTKVHAGTSGWFPANYCCEP